MFGIQHYAEFIMAVVIFQLIPGPGTLAILNATSRQGVAYGMAAVMGTLVGDMVWMLGAALGLAAVMKANPMIFTALQWFGVGYLLWMAWGLLRSGRSVLSETEVKPIGAWRYMWQAALVSLTNPKVMLFFVAFFPQFLGEQASNTTLMAMIAHVTLISLLYQTGLVLVGNTVAQKLKNWPMAQVWAKRLAGVALIGFAAKLAWNNRT